MDEEFEDRLLLSQDSFNKEEWRQVVELFMPDVIQSEFDALWDALADKNRTSVLHRVK